MAIISNNGRDIYIPGDSTYSRTEINVNDYKERRFGTYHMADNPELYEPLRTNNFEFMVTGLGKKIYNSLQYGNSLLSPAYYKGPIDSNTSNEINFEKRFDEVIRVSVDRAFIPHFTQNVVTVKRGNSTIKYAGQFTFGEGQIRIKDYIGLDAKMALMEWQNLSGNVKTEKIGLAADYKVDCFLTEFTPDYIPVRSWKIMGCWISGITESEFDSSAADNINQITATIQYDKGIPWDVENAPYVSFDIANN